MRGGRRQRCSIISVYKYQIILGWARTILVCLVCKRSTPHAHQSHLHTHTHTGWTAASTHTHTRLDNQYIRCTFPFVRHGPSGHNDNNNCTTTTLLQAQKRCVYVLGVCPASLTGCLAGWLPAWRVSMSMSYPFAVL